jgi:hypothetical protein
MSVTFAAFSLFLLSVMGSPISSLYMYNGSNDLAVSRWCAKGSRVGRSRRIEVVDYALERVECWRSGVARWLWHCGPCSGDCWWLVVCCVLMMVGSNRRSDGDDVCILVLFRWVAGFGWWSNRLFNCSCRIITLRCGRCLYTWNQRLHPLNSTKEEDISDEVRHSIPSKTRKRQNA